MILVTGATGHLGGATIDFLLKKVPAGEIVALVRDEAKAEALKARGVIVRKGDYLDPQSLDAALQGIDKVLLVSSSDLKDRADQHRNVIEAAKKANVKLLAYTGVAATKTQGSVFQWFLDSHFNTDQAIRESGIPYTLLHHTLYAEFLPVFTGPKAADTGIHLPAGDGKVPYASRVDMAEAAANVLTGTGHENREYNIGLGTAYSFADVAAILSDVKGKPVTYTEIPAQAFEDFLRSINLPQEVIDVSAGFMAAIKAGELDVPSGDLEKLLGRTPRSLEEVIAAVY